MKKRIEAATKHKEMRAEVTNGKKFVDVLLGVDKQPIPIKQHRNTLIISNTTAFALQMGQTDNQMKIFSQ